MKTKCRRRRRKFLRFGYIQNGGYIQMRARVPGWEQGVSREPEFQLRTPLGHTHLTLRSLFPARSPVTAQPITC